MAFNIRERFKERKFSFLYKKKKEKEKKQKAYLDKQKEDENIFKIILFSPLIFLGYIKNIIDYFSNNDHNNVSNKNNSLNDVDTTDISLKQNNIDNINHYKKPTLEEKTIKKNTASKSNNQTVIEKEIKLKNNYPIVPEDDTLHTVNIQNNMEAAIILKIKKNINKLNNQCDLIESEAYLIKKYGNDKSLLNKAIAIRKEVESLEEKLNAINAEFDNIKDRLLTEPQLIKDEKLVDSIIKYKNTIADIEESRLPNDIKLLDEYKNITIKLEELNIKTKKLEVETKVREKELSERDTRYKNAKEKMLDLDEINNKCNDILKSNQKYIDELSLKVGMITNEKYTKYKLHGLNQLLSTSLKYIGLLSLTPLRGLLPGIAAKTYATRKLVGSMYHSLHYEKQEKIVYSFENYYSELNSKICSISSVEKSIDLALQDIENLKCEFKDKFLKYNLPEYTEAYKKIELLEDDILNSRQKIFLMKNTLIENQKVNKETLTKVRKLNSNNK